VVHSTQRARTQGAASRLATLAAIAAHPQSTPKSLSEELAVHPSSVTRQIQSLEEDGAVKVTANPEDGRSCRVRLTASGRAELQRLNQLGLQRFVSFVARWDAEEVRTLARLLVKLEQSKAEVSRNTQLVGGRWRQLKKK
jgi:DNA-binding MarR family transcriptional regulator